MKAKVSCVKKRFSLCTNTRHSGARNMPCRIQFKVHVQNIH